MDGKAALLLTMYLYNSILLKRHNKSASFPILQKSLVTILFHSLIQMMNPMPRHQFRDLFRSKLYTSLFHQIFKLFIMALCERLMVVSYAQIRKHLTDRRAYWDI